MKNSIIIKGKTYISASRASEITKYSKDYIGQLCREGKLVSERVGRLWFIEERSLEEHQKSVSQYYDSVRLQFSSPNGRTDATAYPAHPFSNLKVVLAVVGILTIVSVFFVPGVVSGLAGVFPKSGMRLETASLSDAMASAGDFLQQAWSAGYSRVASLVSGDQSEPSPQSVIPPGQAGAVSAEHGGLVVVPSMGSTTDAKLAQSIVNSFSDDVQVTPSENGTDGVITPVFRTVKGHDYLYVLVPVKAASTSPQQD